MTEIDCSYEHVSGLAPATPTRIEDIIVSMRSDLLRIITRWEQSGQGEGGMDSQEAEETTEATPNDDDASSLATNNDVSRRDSIGGLCGRSPRALQSRASFLNGRPSYLLYFWEVADAHQILQSSLQRLSNTVGASDSSCAPSTVSTSAPRRRQQGQGDEALHQDLDSSSFTPLVDSIKELANAQRQMLVDRAEDRIHEMQLEEQRHQSDELERSRERIFRRRAELMNQARKYRKLNAELNPNDKRSRRLSEFYVEEGRLLEAEIRALENCE